MSVFGDIVNNGLDRFDTDKGLFCARGGAVDLPEYISKPIDKVKKYSKEDFIMLSDLDYEIKEIAETIEALTKTKFFKENHNAYLYDKSGIIGNQVYKVLEELRKLSYTVQDSWWQVVGDNDVMNLPVSDRDKSV